ncbi:PREDICTED: LOB domain-containing protein 20 isoform X2 [Tarenaya hassleriana]|uniref:LOB domain-containing protein 20 isoform X2 n=1 Tax=Tarenaya hassleriana TaxID=28532 RepID=UPI0008FD601F|nr:PREDICTED: LOB domain-containing protein 20 isoform X2 [Tarenaya hassleriana]
MADHPRGHDTSESRRKSAAAAGKRSTAASSEPPPPSCGGAPASPCGACKFLRRKCVSGCIFAPHFGSDQGAARFAAVHKVFGASNVSKLLHHIPANRRHDAVVTISYEAQARLSDPVYGCVSTILALQQQAEMAVVQTQLINSRVAMADVMQQQSHHHHHHMVMQQPEYSNNSSASTTLAGATVTSFTVAAAGFDVVGSADEIVGTVGGPPRSFEHSLQPQPLPPGRQGGMEEEEEEESDGDFQAAEGIFPGEIFHRR